MGKGRRNQKIDQNKQETPKRSRSVANSEEEEEISPSVLKDSKKSKMGVSDKDFRELSNKVELVLTQLVDVNEKLKALDQIKSTQEELVSHVHTIEKRVEKVEKQYDELRESGINEQLRAEVEEMKKKIHKMDQESSTELIVKNLPLTIIDNQPQLHEVINKLFATINYKIDCDRIELNASKSKDQKSAIVSMNFESPRIKTQVLNNFRDVRKRFKDDCLFLVHKFVSLPTDHHLNGQSITVANKLTPHFARLMSSAREYSSHFDFIYDTPKGSIIMRINGKFEPIVTFEDIHRLLGDKPKDRKEKKKKQDAPRDRVRTRSTQPSTSTSNGS